MYGVMRSGEREVERTVGGLVSHRALFPGPSRDRAPEPTRAEAPHRRPSPGPSRGRASEPTQAVAPHRRPLPGPSLNRALDPVRQRRPTAGPSLNRSPVPRPCVPRIARSIRPWLSASGSTLWTEASIFSEKSQSGSDTAPLAGTAVASTSPAESCEVPRSYRAGLAPSPSRRSNCSGVVNCWSGPISVGRSGISRYW